MTMNEMLVRYNDMVLFKMAQDDEAARNIMEGRMIECVYLLDAFYPGHPFRTTITYKGCEIFGYPV